MDTVDGRAGGPQETMRGESARLLVWETYDVEDGTAYLASARMERDVVIPKGHRIELWPHEDGTLCWGVRIGSGPQDAQARLWDQGAATPPWTDDPSDPGPADPEGPEGEELPEEAAEEAAPPTATAADGGAEPPGREEGDERPAVDPALLEGNPLFAGAPAPPQAQDDIEEEPIPWGTEGEGEAADGEPPF